MLLSVYHLSPTLKNNNVAIWDALHKERWVEGSRVEELTLLG